MSGKAEKATIQQELAAAQPASSTDVGDALKPAGASSVATSVADKVAGDNGIVGQVTPAASAALVEPLVATQSLVALDSEPGRIEEPETSKQNLARAGTAPSEQFKLTPTRSIAPPSVSVATTSADQETRNITDGSGTTPQETAEGDVLGAKPAEIVTGEAETKKVTKKDGTTDVPVVSANGNTRNDIFEMGGAPADKVAANEVEKTGGQAQALGGGKRKADEAFGDSNGDLGNTQATTDISTTSAVDGNETHIKKSGPSRPKKQKRERKILTPIGRTARKTRSQGPVEG